MRHRTVVQMNRYFDIRSSSLKHSCDSLKIENWVGSLSMALDKSISNILFDKNKLENRALFRYLSSNRSFIPQCTKPMKISELIYPKIIVVLKDTRVAMIYTRNIIFVFDFKNPEHINLVAKFRLGSYAIRSMQFMDNDCLITAGSDYVFKIWDFTTSKNVLCIGTITIQNYEYFNYKLITLFNDCFVVCEFNNLTLTVWNISEPGNEDRVAILKGHSDPIDRVTQLEDGRILSISKNNIVKVWDLSKSTNEMCVVTLKIDKGHVVSVTQLKDGRLAFVRFDSGLIIWDLNKAKDEICITTLSKDELPVLLVVQLKDGCLVCADLDNNMKVWDMSKPKYEACVAILTGHSFQIKFIIQLKDERLLSICAGNILKVWDLSKPEDKVCITTVELDMDGVRSVIELDDRRLVITSLSWKLIVCDLYFLPKRFPFVDQPSEINEVEVSKL